MAELTVQTHSHFEDWGAEEKRTEKGKRRSEFGHDPAVCLGEESISANGYTDGRTTHAARRH